MKLEKEIEKVLSELYSVVKTLNNETKSSSKINTELLQTMSLLNEGFAKNEDDARELIDRISNGAEMTDEYAKKWAKQRGATEKDLENIVLKFREIEKLNHETIDNASDYNDLLRERSDLMISENDVTRDLLQNYEQISKIIKENKSTTAQLNDVLGKTDDVLSKLVNKKIDFSQMFSGLNSGTVAIESAIDKLRSNFDNLATNLSTGLELGLSINPIGNGLQKELAIIKENIDKERELRVSALDEFFKKNTKLQTALGKQIAAQKYFPEITFDVDTSNIIKSGVLLDKLSSEYKTINSTLELKVQSENINQDVLSRLEDITGLLSKIDTLTTLEQSSLQSLIEPLDLASKMLVDQNNMREKDIGLLLSTLTAERERYKILAMYSGKLQQAEQLVEHIGSGFDYINGILPFGIGKFIGLQRVSAALTQSHQDGVRAFTDAISKGIEPTEAISEYIDSFAPALTAALNPVTLIVAGMALMYNLVSSISEKYVDLTQSMKVSLMQSKQLLDSQLDILTSYDNQFTRLDDMKEIQAELIGSSGRIASGLNAATKDVVININEMAQAFGYGNVEATKLHKLFKNLGADDSLALNLQANLGLMSEMAGLSPQIISQELLDASKEVSIYFAGMPEKAAKAAIQVHRMGLSLQQAGEIAQKMLNLDDFMTDMYELNAMSGKTIDFSKAFDLGLNGDIVGMTKEIMDNIGTTAELNNMDYLTRMKIAKTLGMSVEDLSKSVRLHEQMAGMTESEQAALDANLDRMGDISKLSKDQIRDRLEQLKSTDRLGVAWDKIKGVLVKTLLPLVETFANVIDSIMPILDIVIAGFKTIGYILKPFIPLIKGLLVPLQFIGKVIEIIAEKLNEWGNSTESMLSPLTKLSDVVYGIGTALGTWMISKRLLNMLGIFKTSTDDASKAISSLGPQINKTADGAIKPVSFLSNLFGSAFNATPTLTVNTTPAQKQIGTLTDQTKLASAEMANDLSKVSKKGNVFQKLMPFAKSLFAFTALQGASMWMSTEQSGSEAFKGVTEAGLDSFSLLSSAAVSMLYPIFEEKLGNVFAKTIGSIPNLFKNIAPNVSKTLQTLIPSFGKVTDSITDSTSEVTKKISVFTKIKNAVIGTISKINVPERPPIVRESLDKMTTEEQTKKTLIPETTITEMLPDTKPVDSLVDKIKSMFGSISEIISESWDKIKDALNSILDFALSSLEKIAKSAGNIISDLLGGLAKGLNQFSINAIKGAAALGIVSAALWVVSKAVENFEKVSWESLGKGAAALTGLAMTGQLLSSMAPQMLMASVGVAALGLALLPLSYALQMFNEIKWSAIGKGIVALAGFSIVGAILAPLLPLLAASSAGIALLGASIIPLVYGLKELSKLDFSFLDEFSGKITSFGFAMAQVGILTPVLLAASISFTMLSGSLIVLGTALDAVGNAVMNFNVDPISAIVEKLQELTKISAFDILAVATSLGALSASLFAFSSSQILSKPLDLFKSDTISDLTRFLDSAKGLNDVANTVDLLISALQRLSAAISGMSFDKLNELELPKLTPEISAFKASTEDLTKRPEIQILNETQADDTNIQDRKMVSNALSVSPVSIGKAAPPSNRSVGLDKPINPIKKYRQEQYDNQYEQNNLEPDNGSEFNTRKMESLLQQLIQVTAMLAGRPVEVNLNANQLSRMNTAMKGFNNTK